MKFERMHLEELEALEAAGATAKVVVTLLRNRFEADEAKRMPKRANDKVGSKVRRDATKQRRAATNGDAARRDATLDDNPRARLFHECVPALMALNIAESRARSLLGQWLKITNDDDQLVTAAVMRARDRQAADAPGFILATLKKRTGNGHHGTSAVASAFDDLIARTEGERGPPGDDGVIDHAPGGVESR